MDSQDAVLTVLGIGAVGLIGYFIYKKYFTHATEETTVTTPIGTETISVEQNKAIAEQGTGGYTIVINTPVGTWKLPGPLGNEPFHVGNLGLINVHNISEQQLEQEVQQALRQGTIPVFVNAPQ